jgi:hypothetical protein
MGRGAAGPASEFATRVIEVINAAINENGTTKAQVLRDSKMPANTFHKKMRGELPFNLNEIEKLANALGRDPLLILREASSGVGGGSQTPPPQGDREVADLITERRKRKPRPLDQVAALDRDQDNE